MRCGSTGSVVAHVSLARPALSAKLTLRDVVRAVAGLLHHVGALRYDNDPLFEQRYHSALGILRSIREGKTNLNRGKVRGMNERIQLISVLIIINISELLSGVSCARIGAEPLLNECPVRRNPEYAQLFVCSGFSIQSKQQMTISRTTSPS